MQRLNMTLFFPRFFQNEIMTKFQNQTIRGNQLRIPKEKIRIKTKKESYLVEILLIYLFLLNIYVQNRKNIFKMFN